MGYPNIPDINPDIDIDREEVIDLLLASIGLEELSLAHLVNAEAEKLQRALGTLQRPGTVGDTPEDFFPELVGDSLDNLLTINRDINKTLKFAMHKEFILLTKLEDVIDFAEEFTPPVTEECECQVVVPESDIVAVIEEIGGEGTLTFGLTVCEGCVVGADELVLDFVPNDTTSATTTGEFVEGSVNVNCEGNSAVVSGTVEVTSPDFPGVEGEYTVVFTIDAAADTINAVVIFQGEVVFMGTIPVTPETGITITDCPLPDNGNGNGPVAPAALR